MSIEAIAATSAAMPPPTETIQAGPGASISDVTSFQGSLAAAGSTMPIGGPDAIGPAIKSMIGQLEKVNGEAKSVAEYAKSASLNGKEMTPGEIVNLTTKCYEFMFHCQLSSSIANRTSDGIQQLFRQQS